MDQRKNQSKIPTPVCLDRRQVNKADKNENLDHGDTNRDLTTNDYKQTTIIEIPKEYEHIIQTTINFCKLRETRKENKDYLEFCQKIKSLWDTQLANKNNPNKIKADEQGILHPLIYMWIEDKKVFLTKEDILILLEYPFNINSRHIELTLKKLKIKTIRGLEPRIGIIYQWKLYEEWKTRERDLLENHWKWKGGVNWKDFHNIKDEIYLKIEKGEFDKEIEEIKKRIEKNHS